LKNEEAARTIKEIRILNAIDEECKGNGKRYLDHLD
jgi:hypothetical protein